jgi:hypothetical protein
MEVTIGKWATGVRQIVTRLNQVLGNVPHLNGPPVVNFTPTYAKNVFQYADPTTPATIVCDDGGEFSFGSVASPDYSIRIIEVHTLLGKLSQVNIDIVDSDGRYARHLVVAGNGDETRHLPTSAYVLPGQRLIITETISGLPIVGLNKVITVYAIQEGRV